MKASNFIVASFLITTISACWTGYALIPKIEAEQLKLQQANEEAAARWGEQRETNDVSMAQLRRQRAAAEEAFENELDSILNDLFFNPTPVDGAVVAQNPGLIRDDQEALEQEIKAKGLGAEKAADDQGAKEQAKAKPAARPIKIVM